MVNRPSASLYRPFGIGDKEDTHVDSALAHSILRGPRQICPERKDTTSPSYIYKVRSTIFMINSVY